MIEATRRRRAVNRDGKNANRPAMYRTTAPMITKPPFPIDDDIDSGYVRTIIGGKEQGDTSHFFRSAEATQQRLTEHVASPRRIAFRQFLTYKGIPTSNAASDSCVRGLPDANGRSYGRVSAFSRHAV